MAALGVNSLHFAAHDFQPVLDGLVNDGRISKPQLTEVPIYDGRNADHAGDMAFVLTFTVS